MTDDYSVNLKQLLELFPALDREIVETVLRSNSGLVEPSIEALLSMADPEYKAENGEQQSSVDRDAEFARSVAQNDINRANAHLNGPRVNFQQPLAASGNHQRAHKKKPSKIRNIFKFGHSSSSGNREERRTGSPLSPPSQPGQPSRTLESDFSSDNSDDNARLRPKPALAPPSPQPAWSRPQQLQQPSRNPPATAGNGYGNNVNEANLINLLDDDNDNMVGSTTYAPLNPSKFSPTANNTTTTATSNDSEAFRDIQQLQGSGGLDLDDPFGSTPLVLGNKQQGGLSSPVIDMDDPFETAASATTATAGNPNAFGSVEDNNPFRHH
ncbi:hypothetical protein GGI12_003322 [Dipsacomyces acuminosporus]|nr:hypothetical protein GGI12_003322 [Dipsacomyces acuminosporus]